MKISVRQAFPLPENAKGEAAYIRACQETIVSKAQSQGIVIGPDTVLNMYRTDNMDYTIVFEIVGTVALEAM